MPYFVFHTATYVDEVIRQKAKIVGIDHVIEKPMNFENFKLLLYLSNIEEFEI